MCIRDRIKDLRKLEPDELSELMNISSKLADENHQRFANWHTPFDLDNAKQAIFAFRGDVYLGLQAEDFTLPISTSPRITCGFCLACTAC